MGGTDSERKEGVKRMERRDCYGSIREITLRDGQTKTQSRPECRSCAEIRDCLRASKQIEDERKERDELKKQDMIVQIIDHSHVLSNEIGSCLLEFLSRGYSSPLGTVLFKNLLLFYEIPRNSSSYSLTIPISRTVMDLLRGEENDPQMPSPPGETNRREGPEGGFTLKIVLFQNSFPNQRQANMGMIAYEVARAFISDDLGVKQIQQTLSNAEIKLFEKMDTARRMDWLIEKWGFLPDFEVFKKETAAEK
jgi:hypothetical protein